MKFHCVREPCPMLRGAIFGLQHIVRCFWYFVHSHKRLLYEHMCTHAHTHTHLTFTLAHLSKIIAHRSFFSLYCLSPPDVEERPQLHLQSCSHTHTCFLCSSLDLLHTALPIDFLLFLSPILSLSCALRHTQAQKCCVKTDSTPW